MVADAGFEFYVILAQCENAAQYFAMGHFFFLFFSCAG